MTSTNRLVGSSHIYLLLAIKNKRKTEVRNFSYEKFGSNKLRANNYHFWLVVNDIMKYQLRDESVNQIFDEINGNLNFFFDSLKKYDVNISFIFSIYCNAIIDEEDSYIESDKLKEIINLYRGKQKEIFLKELDENDPLKRFDSLIGLYYIKQEIKSIIALAKAKRERVKNNLSSTNNSLHMVFRGNPSTGKTTVARMIGEIFQTFGVLKSGHVVEVGRHDLTGKYVGHTAPLIAGKVMEALGGILFINEAYSLTSYDSKNDFGVEAIQTLLKLMEDYGDRFILIVAGYPSEMSLFLNSNPGLKSRFSTITDFRDYTGAELLDIFKLMLKDDELELSKEAKFKVDYIFMEKFIDKGTASNARFIRNYYESILKEQAKRLFDTNRWDQKSLQTIHMDDIMEI